MYVAPSNNRSLCFGWYCFKQGSLFAIFHPIKKTPENAVDKRMQKLCRLCSAKGKRTAKGGYLTFETNILFEYKCYPSEQGLHPESCLKEYDNKIDFSVF